VVAILLGLRVYSNKLDVLCKKQMICPVL